MKHYKGELGDFVFDPAMFVLKDGKLIYVGGTSEGMIKCTIPEGVLHCDGMFENNTHLRVGPVLPQSCVTANNMFAGCKNLMVYPDINLALMESDDFDSSTVFQGCSILESLSVDDSGKSRSVWVCACEHSVDYAEHLHNMMVVITEENKRRELESRVQHPIQFTVARKSGVRFDACSNLLVLPKVAEHVVFDSVTSLTHVLEERKKGHYIGISTCGIRKNQKKTKKQPENAVDNSSTLTREPLRVIENSNDMPQKINFTNEGVDL